MFSLQEDCIANRMDDGQTQNLLYRDLNVTQYLSLNPNSRDNKGSWRILKDLYCSVTMLRELGLK